MEVLDESDTPTFTLQGRLSNVSFWRITTHVGLAFGQSDLAFHVSVTYACVHPLTLQQLII